MPLFMQVLTVAQEGQEATTISCPHDLENAQGVKEFYLHSPKYEKKPVVMTSLFKQLSRHPGLSNMMILNADLCIERCVYKFPAMQVLTLENVGLTRVPAMTWYMHKLQELHLFKNAIPILPDRFGQLPMLRVLNLHKNQLNTLPPSLAQCKMLHCVILSKNEFTHFPPVLRQLPRLTKIILSHNHLESLDGVHECTHLTLLHVDNNRLTELPSLLALRLPVLSELNVCRNDLLALPFNFDQCTTLRILNVADNDRLVLPSQFVFSQLLELNVSRTWARACVRIHCPKLQRLVCKHATLDADMVNVVCLRQVNLCNAGLTQVPRWLLHCDALEELDLSHNRLTQLPPELCQLGELRELLVHQNRLSTLPLTIHHLTHLELLTCDASVRLPFTVQYLPQLAYQSLRPLWTSSAHNAAMLRGAHMAPLWVLYADMAESDLNASLLCTLGVNAWLEQLTQYRFFDMAMVTCVCDMLMDVGRCPRWTALFFEHIGLDLQHCGDRAAMGHNCLYVHWKLCKCLAQDVKTAALTLIAAAKTLCLRKYMSTLVVGRETVEAYLWAESELKDTLGLLTFHSSIAYDWKIVQLKQQNAVVNTHTLDAIACQVVRRYRVEFFELVQALNLLNFDPINEYFSTLIEEYDNEGTDGEYLQHIADVQARRQNAIETAIIFHFCKELQADLYNIVTADTASVSLSATALAELHNIT